MQNVYLLERQVDIVNEARRRDAERFQVQKSGRRPAMDRFAAVGRALVSRARHDVAGCADDVTQALGQARAAGRSQDAVCCA